MSGTGNRVKEWFRANMWKIIAVGILCGIVIVAIVIFALCSKNCNRKKLKPTTESFTPKRIKEAYIGDNGIGPRNTYVNSYIQSVLGIGKFNYNGPENEVTNENEDLIPNVGDTSIHDAVEQDVADTPAEPA